MKEKVFLTRCPFGVASKRFDGMGFHPGLDPTGCMIKNKSALGPGQYNLDFYDCSYKKYNVGGSSWKRKADVEEFSKTLGFRNAQILKTRIFQKSIGGPGFYDIPEEIYRKQTSSCMYNIGFGLKERFSNPFENNNPPPGTYGKDFAMGHKEFSNYPTFERDGFIDRFKSRIPAYAKPPNLYNPKDPGTVEAVLAKVVSKRGPYDCFTGPRDGSTIKNHFAPPAFKGPINWFNTYPNDLEVLLKHPGKQRYGRFFKEVRFGIGTSRNMVMDPILCYRNPNDPSPCQYTVESPREFKQNLAPFNMSVKDQRPPIKWKIEPGVGRYGVKYPKCNRVNKQPSWVFKSKTGRTEYKAVEYNSF